MNHQLTLLVYAAAVVVISVLLVVARFILDCYLHQRDKDVDENEMSKQ